MHHFPSHGIRAALQGNLGAWKIHGIPDDILKKFRTLMNDSYVVADLRARVVHDPWYIENVSGQTAQFRAMPPSDPQFGFREITQKEIDDTIAKIRLLGDRINSLRTDLLDKFRA